MPQSDMNAQKISAQEHLKRSLARQNSLMMALGEFSDLSLSEIMAGDQDPYEGSLATCSHCHCEAKLIPVARHTIKWSVACTGCDSEIIEPQKTEAKAIITWNTMHPETQDYRDIPFFGLSELSPDEARTKMARLQRFLEINVKLIGTERTIAHATGHRPPKMVYQHKVEFYLKWVFLSLALIKSEAALSSDFNRSTSLRKVA